MKQLRISPELSLPIESVTESIAILAKRGAGKTYAASVLVEEMLKAKLQVVVLDPIGAWWGLRSSADGRGEGFSIAILGGDRGDVPLEPTGGSVAADLLVDERLPAILDLASFSKNERRRFVGEFLERLYQRNREAMHVVLEEADLFAPEGKLKRAGDEQMLGAVYDLVRRGRGRGMGSTLITQRSASLSKEVLTQAEILLALRTTGPHDRVAIEEWIKFHGSKKERDVVLSSLAELPTGEAWAWWPVEGILKRIRIRQRETFDSSATPKPGQTQREPKTLADVDLAALQQRMASTIEKAKVDDPRALRKKILELEQLVKKQDRGLTKSRVETVVEEKLVEKIVEVPVLTKLELQRLDESVGALRAVADQIEAAARESKTARAEGDRKRASAVTTRVSAPGSPRRPAPERRPPQEPPREPVDLDGVSGPQQRILDALAQLAAIGISVADKTQLALFAKASPKELELMSVEIAEWQTTLPPGYRHAIMRALRQVLNAAIRWRLIRENPAKEAGANPRPQRKEVAFFQSLADVDKTALELGARYGALVVFGVETGLRPEEWIALERRDIDREAALAKVTRVVVDGQLKEYGKTARSRRSVPLTERALAAIDSLPRRIDTPLLFSAPKGGYIDLDNFRRREWRPAIEAAGLDLELHPYSMRHTFAAYALDARAELYELARVMGTSTKVIDDTYGHLVRGSLDRFRVALEQRAKREAARAEAR